MTELIFKPLFDDDTKNIFLASKGNVADYFYKFETLKEAEQWVSDAILQHSEGTKLEYVVYEGDKFVGMISPRYLDANTVDIGMWVSVDFQGKGYGKRILGTLLAELKSKGVKEVVYETDKDNMASIALAKSLGFKLSDDSIALVFKLFLDKGI